ncbi:MAG: multidrug efflux RND transporter permease subunit [Helicobacteraceae bacterium]|nr:multidrug efflux RND transporter permease subunit [Helicobacteraceae bacterium]
MFSVFFIKRPIFAKVIAILTTLLGLIAIPILPIAQFPELTPSQVQVTATYTGGSALVVENSVTRPIEEQVNGVEGMLYMSSTSAADGSAKISVFFEPGYPLSIAAVDVQNRVSMAMSQLPQEVQRTGVQTKKVSTNMVQAITLSSESELYNGAYLSNYASINIVNELKSIAGVGDVMIWGEKKYSMRIWLDPNKMAAMSLAPSDVTNAIDEQNKQAALGQIGASPMPHDNMFQYTITSKTRLDSTTEFENIVIRANSDGSILRLKDIAKVELGAETYSWESKLNAKPSAVIAVFQLPGANTIDIANHLNSKIKELSKRFPEGLVAKATYDSTKFVRISMKEVVQTLFEALILVVIVTFVFLQSWRSTFIPTLAIPVSLIGTFAVMLAIGFSINTLTLFGLILAIGIVVDDGIIVVENVERVLEEEPDLSVMEATEKAVKEIMTPVISTTLVLLAVFIPVAFIPGLSGALYKQFALTISISVLISAINALSLSPALAASMIKRSDPTKKKAKFFIKFDEYFDRFRSAYVRFLTKIIAKWQISIVLFIAGLGLTVYAFQALPTGFVPDEDQGAFVVSIQLQSGAALEQTERASKEAQGIIQKMNGVVDIIEVDGFSAITQGRLSNAALFYVVLEDWDKRKTPELALTYIMAQVKDKTSHIDGASVSPFNLPSIPGLSPVGGFSLELQNYSSAPLQEFKDYADKVIEEASKDPRILYAITTFANNYPQLEVDIDRSKAQTLDLKMSDVFTALQVNLGSVYVNDFNKFGKVYRVYVQADQKYRQNPDDISKLFVKNSNGDMVPLSAIVKVKRTNGASMINHFNTYRNITINGLHNIKDGYSSGDAITAMKEICDRVLPSSYGYKWSGMSLQEITAGNAALYIFMLSIFIVFLFLAAQYESWLMPLMIMLPIPIVLFGALGSNMIAGLMNNIYTQVGMVLLIGMASKNAILIVEFAKDLREEGQGITEAAINAASQRLRPILMTAFAFILGVYPLVVASGAGAASRNAMGTAVFGGMIMSTILTLLFTPVLFVLLERLREKKGSVE